MRCWIELSLAVPLVAMSLAMMPVAGFAQPLAVEVSNASRPTLCAEEDNVYFKLISREVRGFTVEALHPAYLPTLTADNKDPDFSRCEMSVASDRKFTPRRVTLHDGGKWKLIGITYPNFWRPAQVPVEVDGRAETGLHLLQLWTRGRSRDEEVLVLYPADGYWRARPLAPAKLGWQPDPLLPTAYGSSFLVGPVAEEGRPFVDIRAVKFDPGSDRIALEFSDGSSAMIHIRQLDETRITLDVALAGSVSPQFAALRSMFVAPDNADAAVVWWTDGSGASHASEIMKFGTAKVTAFRAGRSQPSGHNTSAPDMAFGNFSAQAR